MKRVIWIIRDNIPGTQDISVLYCDDYKIVENSTKKIANDGVRGPSPDLVILVILKNEETSLMALKKIRKQHPQASVIVISSTRSIGCAEACANLSTQGYFVAPLDPYRFCEKIRKVMLKRSLQKEENLAPMILNEKVRQAIKIINENYNKPITVRSLSENVCLSSNHFGKIFKKETGYNIIDYINYYRIFRAKQFLQDHPGADFMTVAEKVGFSDVYYFSRVFKKYTEQSPRQYKNNLKYSEMTNREKKNDFLFFMNNRYYEEDGINPQKA